jgi:hypothetical protein
VFQKAVRGEAQSFKMATKRRPNEFEMAVIREA